MIIVGLTGSIGSGKTTFADFLAARFDRAEHWESWQLIAEVADALRAGGPHPDPGDITAINRWLEPLPDIINTICHKQVIFEKLKLSGSVERKAPEYIKLFQYLELMWQQPDLAGGAIDEERKEALRSILQWLGGYLAAKCGGDIWYAEIIRRIQSDTALELATIGGVRFLADAQCVKGAGGFIMAIDRSDWTQRDKTDPTERERGRIAVDSTIYNDSSLEKLAATARIVASDLLAGKLQASYRADELQA